LLSLPTLLSVKTQAWAWFSWSRCTETDRRNPILGDENSISQSPLNRQDVKLDRSEGAGPALPPTPAGLGHARAKEAFRRARDLYHLREYDEAAEAFHTALRYDETNALYAYVLAMAYYQLRRYEQAERYVQKAVELERTQPVSDWGMTMQRYQGGVRVWLEGVRNQARQTEN
jgi:tetratricopeptide (TPR) repeat protein